MDWSAFSLSVALALSTVAVLLPIGLVCARLLAYRQFPGKPLVEALVILPLVLPPTVLGYYLLQAFGSHFWIGRLFQAVFGYSLNFSFSGLLLASVVFNLPFMVQPLQRAFESIPVSLYQAGQLCGLSFWRIFVRIELPLAWRGVLSALVLTFVHTLGEFGVVLMIGGNIPGQTRTLSIAIYDSVQGFELDKAQAMSLTLLLFCLLAVAVLYLTPRKSRSQRA